MNFVRLLANLTAALAIATAPAFAVEITTETGPKTIDKVPAKVAVYDIAAIDMLTRLGIQPAGIPDKLFVPELPGVAKARLAAYGELFAKPDEAAAAKELDAAVEAARQAVKGKVNALILMTNGPKITAYGPGSRFGWVHKTLDLEPAVADVEAATHGEAISFEFISKTNPDWLLVLDRAAAIGSNDQGAKATLDNELVAQTTAWKKSQVIFLPSPDFYIAAGGVQSTHRVLSTIEQAFAKAK